MDYAKNINVECTSNELMTFYLKEMYSIGNNGLAKELGIHPSKSSRDKARIFDLACMLVSKFGLPPDSVNVSDKPTKIVLEGDYAERVIQALEGKGKFKRKAPTAGTDEAQIKLDI
ncbi:hypothetical protein AB7315_07005 [Providencia manganoxydans]|uniref:hypothetical protein n=1 Tax=Providencia manganoxydans TaxID=2923283 RepID=UPI0034E583C8